jgi:hypothetical protein
VEYGQTVTTIVLKAGWTGIGKGDGSADGDGDTELGLNSEGVPAAIDESTGTAEGDADGKLRDFIDLTFDERTTKTWNLPAEGLYGPIHDVGGSTDSFELTYNSKSKGKSIGDVYGLASNEERSADFESDLTGDGTSLLLVVESHVLDSDIHWINYSGPTLTQVDEQFSQREEYFSKYDITGNATGVRNDDGSVTWTLDAEIRDYLDVDYDYSNLYTTKETHALDSFSRRIANFDAAKMTRSTLVGGGTISPHPGGDTGGLTATESKSRSGDTEVSIIFAQTDTGEAATGLEIPVEKTNLELELEAMFADYEESDFSGEGENPILTTPLACVVLHPIKETAERPWWASAFEFDASDFVNPIGTVTKPLLKPLAAFVARVIGRQVTKNIELELSEKLINILIRIGADSVITIEKNVAYMSIHNLEVFTLGDFREIGRHVLSRGGKKLRLDTKWLTNPKLQSQFQSLWDNGETFARGVIKDRRETPDLIPGRPPLTRYIIEFDLEECMKRVKK